MIRRLLGALLLALPLLAVPAAADTTSDPCQWVDQTTGGNSNTWGDIADANFGKLEDCFTNVEPISVTGSDVTLTDDENRSAVLSLSGTLTGNRSVIVRTAERVFIVKNGTSGAFSVTVKTSAGTGIVVPQGTTAILYCDGTNVVSALTAGTDYQAADADLTAIAGLTSAANKGIMFTGSGTAATYDLTAAGLALLDDAAASNQRTTLGLGSLATASTINNDNWSGTDLAVTNGGTGASDASGARTALGLVIGTNVQAYDADLAALAGVTSGADALPYFTGSGTASTTTLTSFGRSLIDDAAASNARSTLGVVIGTDVQAQDTELAAIAGLTSAADRLPYFTGAGTAALATFTSAGRALLDDADASAQRTTLGLGGLAVLSTVGSSEITNGSVANADLATMANATVKARNTSGTGAPEDVSATDFRTLMSLFGATSVQTFTVDGTWTKPTGLLYAVVISTGGGGGGGGADCSDTACKSVACGGAAGGTSIEVLASSALGSSETVTVGEGGAGGSSAGGNGTAGEDTTFGALHTAGGGAAGAGVNQGVHLACVTSAAGGTSSGGSLNITGQNGSPAIAASDGDSGFLTGEGGASFWGGGGTAGGIADPTTPDNKAGVDGAAYGSGGSGGGVKDTTAGVTGGDGAGGVVFVLEFKANP